MAAAMARTLIRRKPTTVSSIFSKIPIAAHIRPFCAVAERPSCNSPPRRLDCSKMPPPHIAKEYVETGNPPIPTSVDPYRANYWEVTMILPDREMSRDEIIDLYVKTLASAEAFGGSEEEARKKIYSVSTHYFFFFICNVSLEIAEQIEKLPRVFYVGPIADRDVKREDFALSGEPFIDGQAVPYDPKYHETILGYFFKSSRCNPGEEHLRPATNNKDRAVKFAEKIAARRALQSLIEPPSTKQEVPC